MDSGCWAAVNVLDIALECAADLRLDEAIVQYPPRQWASTDTVIYGTLEVRYVYTFKFVSREIWL